MEPHFDLHNEQNPGMRVYEGEEIIRNPYLYQENLPRRILNL